MFSKQDLRGIVTLFMLIVFAAAIFVPPVLNIQLLTEFVQSVIQLTAIVVTFYFANAATKDKM